MIARIKGQIVEKEAERVVVEANGIGYEVFVSDTTWASCDNGEYAQFSIYTHVKEDAFILFGFLSKAEKQLFESLIKINGIGPKMAIRILSGASTDSLIAMIDQGDVKGLTGLPKVGKKTAEQMILSLRGKLVQVSAKEVNTAHKAVRSALINLGYRGPDVDSFLETLPTDVDLEKGVRLGLQSLSQGVSN